MSLSDFFTPVNIHQTGKNHDFLSSQLGSVVRIYQDDFPDLEEIDIAIFGVLDDRRSVNNQGCAAAANAFRKKFYQLHQGDYTARIADIGDIQKGHSVSDTYVAIKTVVSELIKKGIVPIIFGGGQGLTYGQYTAYESLEQRAD